MELNDKKLFGTDGIRGTVNGDKVNALMAVNLPWPQANIFMVKQERKDQEF